MTKDFSTTLENFDMHIASQRASKNKVKIFIYSIRKNAISIVFCLFSICLVLFSASNLTAAKNGLILWATAVVPSLFPFFVATELLSQTNIISLLGKYFNFIMRPLFCVPGEASFAFLMGLISGYPVGAKIVSSFKESGICTKEEAERMIAFTNNSGPLFIIGTVGVSLFGNSKIGILLFITHLLSSITVGILLNVISHFKNNEKLASRHSNNYNLHPISSENTNLDRHYRNKKLYKNTRNIDKSNNLQSSNNKEVSFSSLGDTLGKSITNATSTIFLIGGFVVIFSVIISILNQSGIINFVSIIASPILSIFNIPAEFGASLISGIVELTNGVSLVAAISGVSLMNIKIILCAFLLGFGGISVLLQVFSIVSKSGLSIKTYFVGKFFQGVFAAFYTFIALQFIAFV